MQELCFKQEHLQILVLNLLYLAFKICPFFFPVKGSGAYFCFGAGMQRCQRSALELARTGAGEPPKLLLGGSVPLYFKKPLGIMTGSLQAIWSQTSEKLALNCVKHALLKAVQSGFWVELWYLHGVKNKGHVCKINCAVFIFTARLPHMSFITQWKTVKCTVVVPSGIMLLTALFV